MKRIQCIIVDDEPLARELISTYVSRLEGWELVKSCRSPMEAYEALYQHEIDVMFLDIQMPVISGIEFLSSLKRAPSVIFTTAHPEFAVSAFDLKAIDYLLKPITEERFLQAIEKVKITEAPAAIVQQQSEIDYTFLKQDGRLIKVMFSDILYIEALKDFSKVFLKQGTMLIGSHLKQLEDQLPGNKFSRLHRSYIVALHAITAIQGNTVEIGRTAIPIGGMYKEELLKRLNL